MVVASGLGFVVFFLMGDFELKWDQAQNDRGSDPVPAGAQRELAARRGSGREGWSAGMGFQGDALPSVGSPGPLQALWWREGKGMKMER